MKRAYWFSPLPPARTDIARFTERLAPHLRQFFDLQVVDPTSAHTETGAVPASDARELNRSAACFYNIGNNPVFHGTILRAAMRHPGIVILHDRTLQDMSQAVLDAAGAGAYMAAMLRWYGRSGRDAARAALAGEVTLADLGHEYPLFEIALDGALGAVTHSALVAEEIAERFPALPVLTLHLPYPPQAVSISPRPLKAGEPIRLVMFGFLNPNRRLTAFLAAWALSPWRDRFQLDIAGEVNDAHEVAVVLERTGLQGQVRQHGFVADALLDQLIGNAHLALNLRNPSMGEASGSQLRIWSNETASVVSDTAWYSRLPEGSVFKVGLESEQEDIIALLADLANGRIDLDAVACKGSQSLRAGDPYAYAANLAQWLEREEQRMHERWTEAALIDAVARSFAQCLPPRFVPRLPPHLLDPVPDWPIV